MSSEDKNFDYSLLDLVDINLLQDFQDNFSRITGVSAIIIEDKGPITNPSNFPDFCGKLTRTASEGFSRCTSCVQVFAKEAFEKSKPVIFDCHVGLTSFVVPIVVNNKHLASIIGGQVRTQKPDETNIIQTAKEIGIDENQYIEAFKKVKVMSKKKIESAIKMVTVAATAISQIAQNNYDLMEKDKKSGLVSKVAEKIRSSLDLDEVFNLICSELARAFNVQRTFIVKFIQEDSLTEFSVMKEFLSRPDIRGLEDDKFDVRTINYWGEELLKRGHRIVVDNIQESDVPDYFKETYSSIGEKATVGIAISQGDDAWGWVGIAEYDDYRHWTEEEISALETISNQIYVSIKQAELYSDIKKFAERENLTRTIIETIRSSLDVEETRKRVVNIVGKTLNTDRCYIAEFDKNKDQFLIVEDEYVSNPNLKSAIGRNINNDIPNFASALRDRKTILVNNKKIFVDNVEYQYKEEKKVIEEFNVFSGFAFPLFYYNELLGMIAIQYIQDKKFVSKDEIDFITLIADQVAVAIHQAKIYRATFLSAEKEASLRKIISIISSTFDLDQVKYQIVNQIGKVLHADRVFFGDYNPDIKNYTFPSKSEYRSSKNLKPIQDIDFVSVQGYEVNIRDIHLSGADIIYENIDEYAKEKFPETPQLAEVFKENGFVAAMGTNVTYGDHLFGNLVVSFNHPQFFSQEDINFIKTIAKQTGLIMQQIKLYETIKNQAEIEHLNRTIVETIRSSLDLDEVFTLVTDKLAHVFNAQKTIIAKFEEQMPGASSIKVMKEYKSSPGIQDVIGPLTDSEIDNYWRRVIIKEKKNVVIDDLEKADVPDSFKNMYKKAGQKSVLGVGIRDGEEVWGWVGLGVYNEPRHWSAKEINILETISSQIYIAIKQAELYNQLKQKTRNQNAILNNMPFMAWLKDLNGKFLAVNEAFAKMCNSTVDNILGKTDFDFFPKDAAQAYVDQDEIVIKNKHSLESEDIILGPQGPAWHETFKSPILDEKGEVIGSTGLSREITERKAAQEELLRRQEIIIKANQRESLLRQILETMRSSLNLNVIKRKIVEEVGKALGADVCFIISYNPETEFFFIDENSEYRSSLAELSFVGIDSDVSGTNFFVQAIKKKLDVKFPNVDQFLQEQNLVGKPEERYLKDHNVKSGYLFACVYANELQGYIGLSYSNSYRTLDNNELEFLKIIASQAGTAIYQAGLFEQSREQAEREALLREIVELIRSSLDSEIVKHEIVRQIGLFLRADRVVFADYNFEKENYFVLPGNEYRLSENVKTFIGYDFSATPGFVENIKRLHFEGKDIIFNDLDKYLAENNLVGTDIEKFYRDMGIISLIAINIDHGAAFYGNLVVTFDKKTQQSQKDIRMLKTLANQAGIAIYQSNLHKKEKQTAKREFLLRKSIETIRSFIDIDQVLTTICDEIAKIFNVQRATIVQFPDPADCTKWKVRREYKARKDVKGLADIAFDKRAGDYNGRVVMKEGNHLLIDDIAKSDTPDYYKKTYMEMGVKSILSVPIKAEEDRFGLIFLCSVDAYRHWTKEEERLLDSIASQIHVAIKQAELYEMQKQTAERETLLRIITEKIRSSLDIEETLQFICEETAKLFNVQRTGIAEFTNPSNFEEYKIRKEYLASESIKRLVISEKTSLLPVFWANNVIALDKVLAVDNIDVSDLPAAFKDTYKDMGVKSIIGAGIRKGDDIIGTLVLSEYQRYRHWSEEEKTLLKTIADQVYIAIDQAKLFEKEKKTAQREKLLKDIVVAIRSSIDINEVKKKIVEELCRVIKADRCFFRNYNKVDDMFSAPEFEYLSSDTIKTTDGEIPDQQALRYAYHVTKNEEGSLLPIFFNEKELKGTPSQNYYESLGVKSGVIMPANSSEEDEQLTYLILHYTKEASKFSDEDKKMLEAISGQISIALEQAKLYKTTQLNAERSRLIGNIVSKVISSFDVDEMKEVVKDIGMTTKADKCFFVEVDVDKKQVIPISEKAQYLASSDIKSVRGTELTKEDNSLMIEMFLQSKSLIVVDYKNLNNIPGRYLEMLERYRSYFSIKSAIGIPFFYMNKLTAVLVVEYIKERVLPAPDEIDFLRLLGNQVGMVYKQIMLYQDAKKTAEIEKFNRSILEILRTTLDKRTIKHLFVKNIGKYFKADRVFLSEYDPKNKKFLPVDFDAEYLSSPSQKSFVGFDWSDPTIGEYVQPLIEKRELNIDCWEDYKSQKHKSQAFIDLFEDSDVKSSYNLPVMYQDRLMGYFSIEFTGDECKRLSQDDINRIRNICSQAGVSLYQAELFEKYQESDKSKKDFISNISNEFKQPLDNIIEYTDALIDEKLDKNKEIEYLNNINENSKHLLQLRDDIISISKLESDNFKLDFQFVDSSNLILSAINNLDKNIQNKNIQIKTSLANSNVKADKEKLYQIVYGLLYNAISLIPKESLLLVQSSLNRSTLIVAIEIRGAGMDSVLQNKIFETFKRLDASYVGGRKSIGLGLFLVMKLSELQGCAIQVDSTEDNGTRIWFELNNAVPG